MFRDREQAACCTGNDGLHWVQEEALLPGDHLAMSISPVLPHFCLLLRDGKAYLSQLSVSHLHRWSHYVENNDNIQNTFVKKIYSS
jgi:hypothetical protein